MQGKKALGSLVAYEIAGHAVGSELEVEVGIALAFAGDRVNIAAGTAVDEEAEAKGGVSVGLIDI